MGNSQNGQVTRWANLIDAVKTPLNFFTLALLVAQGILVFLAQKAQGADFRILLVAALSLTFVLVIFVGAIQYKGLVSKPTTEKENRPDYKYDVFLSVPMAALPGGDYTSVRDLALKVKEILEKDCHASGVYYAGTHFEKPEWDPSDASALDDLEALKKSRFFVLLYPSKTASSAIFEAGYALALKQKALYFTTDRKELPFLMQEIEKAFPSVKVYAYRGLEDIRKILTNRKCFDLSEAR